jgi:hypothetical protein
MLLTLLQQTVTAVRVKEKQYPYQEYKALNGAQIILGHLNH